ncbi:MAG TPA: di-trans,poly-cis-decaprenylcistransferase [Candidatus Fimivicinus intestinavium]|nr:di-trans,poly-cis-decaprenylcistransferase [Candidatus Fimivicinus intestinavium]
MPAIERQNLPQHVGIIMDGNGRWAKQRGMQRSEGHKEGARVFRRICEYANDIGIRYITFYAFSTENWARPPQEVSAIMDLLREYLFEAEDRKKENAQRGMRIRFIGSQEGLPQDIVALMQQAQAESLEATRTVVNIAVNYGGRQELLHSVRELARQVQQGAKTPEELTLADIEAGLYTAGQPDPDLIIRPSGEYRLSNFLIWQAAYAEFWYSDVLWPDFTEADFDRALASYQKRSRRFGGI